MSRQIDRKDRPVRVAEYRYRHEAELAAGFLSDAGIPFRLQVDDAGGADLGLSMLRPAVLWVRAIDEKDARDLVALDEDEPEAAAPVAGPHPVPDKPAPRLSGLERSVSVGLAVALLAIAPNLSPSQFRGLLVGLCYAGGFVFLAAALVGRAPEPLGGLIRMLSGSHPR